jgi:hypothetical protein
MVAADFMALLFAAIDTLRALAYLPQIVSIWRDHRGANAVSIATWSLFASNGTTVAYALVTLHDRMMALIFASNALCCVAIVTITSLKRFRRRV